MRVTRKVGWDPFNEVTLCIHSRHLLWQLEMINVGKCGRVLTGNWHDPLQSIYKRGSLGRRGLSMINQSCYEILIVDLSLVFWGKDIKKEDTRYLAPLFRGVPNIKLPVSFQYWIFTISTLLRIFVAFKFELFYSYYYYYYNYYYYW